MASERLRLMLLSSWWSDTEGPKIYKASSKAVLRDMVCAVMRQVLKVCQSGFWCDKWRILDRWKRPGDSWEGLCYVFQESNQSYLLLCQSCFLHDLFFIGRRETIFMHEWREADRSSRFNSGTGLLLNLRGGVGIRGVRASRTQIPLGFTWMELPGPIIAFWRWSWVTNDVRFLIDSRLPKDVRVDWLRQVGGAWIATVTEQAWDGTGGPGKGLCWHRQWRDGLGSFLYSRLGNLFSLPKVTRSALMGSVLDCAIGGADKKLAKNAALCYGPTNAYSQCHSYNEAMMWTIMLSLKLHTVCVKCIG